MSASKSGKYMHSRKEVMNSRTQVKQVAEYLITQNLENDMGRTLLAKAENYLDRGRTQNIDSTLLPTIAIDIACEQLKIPFNTIEAMKGQENYFEARDKLLGNLNIPRVVDYQAMSVIFGCTRVVSLVNKVAVRYQEIKKCNLENCDLKMALFVVTCIKAGVKLDRSRLNCMGAAKKIVKDYQKDIEKHIPDMLAGLKSDFNLLKRNERPQGKVGKKETESSNVRNSEDIRDIRAQKDVDLENSQLCNYLRPPMDGQEAPVELPKKNWKSNNEPKKIRFTTGDTFWGPTERFVDSQKYKDLQVWKKMMLEKLKYVEGDELSSSDSEENDKK